MLRLHKLSAAALAIAAPLASEPTADPVDTAAQALSPIGIKDGVGLREFFVARTTSTGCVTVLHGTGAEEISIDWKQAEVVAMSEDFLSVRTPSVRLAIVADVERPDQYKKLVALSGAMGRRAKECAGPSVLTDADRPAR